MLWMDFSGSAIETQKPEKLKAALNQLHAKCERQARKETDLSKASPAIGRRFLFPS